mmetsp:Transcript_956/g.1077  ORF Transcript_956/g.1077 Transcript_956/m.1077 type:complete len:88 (+) Transcript_956:161-424(+)
MRGVINRSFGIINNQTSYSSLEENFVQNLIQKNQKKASSDISHVSNVVSLKEMWWEGWIMSRVEILRNPHTIYILLLYLIFVKGMYV